MKTDVDLSQHPAFASLIPQRAVEATEYQAFFREADAITADVFRGQGAHGDAAGLAARWTKFEDAIKPGRKKIEQMLAADSATDPAMALLAKNSLRRGLERLALEAEQRRQRMRPEFTPSDFASKAAEHIAVEGFHQFYMPDKWLKPLQQFMKEDVDELRAKFATASGHLLIKESGELPQAIVRDFCQKCGVFESLSTVFGREFNRVGFSLHVSHPGDRWFNAFSDVGLPVSHTADMHYDEAYDVPKAMIYLNDVTEDQGPFTLIPKSDQWDDLGSWLNYKKELAISMAKHRIEVLKEERGSGNASLFRSRELRRLYASLPDGLRGSVKPGDLILNDTPMSRDLLAVEKRITGPAGCLALFCGSHTIHRGGICNSGERWALQVCFWPKDKVKPPAKAERPKTATTKAPEPKKSFFASFFGGGKTAASKPAPEKQEATPDKPKAAKAPAEPADVYSNKRFSLGLKQILGDDLRLSVVDVGGAVNLQPHWHRFHQVADFTVYEPHPKSYQDLIERQQSGNYYKAFRYINAALSGAVGPRTLYITNAPTGTSLLPLKKGSMGDFPENSYLYPMREETIQTTTLAQSLSDNGIGEVHGVKLDTQGTEMEIIRGLGADLSKGLLLVEMEIGTIEHYATPSASLVEAIPYFASLGLELFDLRTNRTAGNAIRLKPGSVTDVLKCHAKSPALAQRLHEVDAIFLRDPLAFIDGGASVSEVRRLMALFCAYNFYGEAIFTADYAEKKGLIDIVARDALFAIFKQLHAEASLEVREYEAWLSSHQWQNWGQYMWVPYPGA